MNLLKQSLVSPQQAAEWIRSGASLSVAADEAVLAALPCGQWIGGSIPYFMGQNGGVTTREQVFVTPLPVLAGNSPKIVQHDVATLSQICAEAPTNGFSLVILPAFSEVHFEYAQNAAQYEDMFIKPVVGWVSGIHLDDMGRRVPVVRDGRQVDLLEHAAVVMHQSLPDEYSVSVNIVNLFRQGKGDILEFITNGFEVSTCLVNGKSRSLAGYLKSIGHDTRLPLVSDHCGAQINVSIKAVDAVADRVEFYGPVFTHTEYRLAQPFEGQYEQAFRQATQGLQQEAGFSCNCILNYLYSELEGKKTGAVIGPMTFGEVAYVLLNQTMVHLSIEKH